MFIIIAVVVAEIRQWGSWMGVSFRVIFFCFIFIVFVIIRFVLASRRSLTVMFVFVSHFTLNLPFALFLHPVFVIRFYVL